MLLKFDTNYKPTFQKAQRTQSKAKTKKLHQSTIKSNC